MMILDFQIFQGFGKVKVSGKIILLRFRVRFGARFLGSFRLNLKAKFSVR